MSQAQSNTVTRKKTASTQPQAALQWKAYEPHTVSWFAQALIRYPNAKKKLTRIQEIAASDAFICFGCEYGYSLSDIYRNGDRTQTFRYCRNCISTLQQSGIDITIMQHIEDPPADELQETEQHNALKPSQETTRLPVIETLAAPAASKHPLFYVGITAFCFVLLLMIISIGFPFVQTRWNEVIYQSPPINQADIRVNTTLYHIVAQNLNGNIILIAEPYADITHLHEYTVAKVSSESLVPTISYDGVSTVYVRVGDSIYMVKIG